MTRTKTRILVFLLSIVCISCEKHEWQGFLNIEKWSVDTQRLPERELPRIKNLRSLKRYLNDDELRQVQIIYLAGVPFVESLDGIELFPVLKDLGIEQTRIESLKGIQNSRLLESVETVDCALGDYSAIAKSSSIEWLRIRELDKPLINFSQNESIKYLSVSEGSFVTLEDLLPAKFYPKSLRLLAVANVGLVEIDSFLKTNTQIQDLYVGHNAIEEIDLSLVKAPLTELTLNDNPFIERYKIKDWKKVINGTTVFFYTEDSD